MRANEQITQTVEGKTKKSRPRTLFKKQIIEDIAKTT